MKHKVPKRVLLKLSGEALMGDLGYGHCLTTLNRISEDIKEILSHNIQVCIVVGGGNIIRGELASKSGFDRANADYMGMLATVINSLAMQNSLEKYKIDTRVLSAIRMESVCEPFIRRRAIRHMEKGRVVICAAGTGNPFFTTDTASVLRAIELNCDMLLKGTQVDGVYTSDPKKDLKATKFKNVDYKTVIRDELKVMDGTAITLAKENKLPILVFSIAKKGGLKDVIFSEGEFTTIS